ncbi:MAG: META domain-containing protein [Methylococcaceae bacterium]
MAKQDEKLRLHDIWVLETISSKQLNLKGSQKRPRLEMNLQKMRVSGNDSCNNFFGTIEHIDQNTIVFSSIAVTRNFALIWIFQIDSINTLIEFRPIHLIIWNCVCLIIREMNFWVSKNGLRNKPEISGTGWTMSTDRFIFKEKCRQLNKKTPSYSIHWVIKEGDREK